MADTDVTHTDVDELAGNVADGRRSALATALNLLDDRRSHRRRDAAELLSRLAGQPARDNRLIGMTGPPGVGKSSLGAALIGVWRSRDLRVGVLAVDPSSPVSGGALLGDRLRMKTGDNDDGVFIRSLSSRGEYGGLSAEVWPMSLVMLAACDVVLVETVGVGQREADIAMSCDTTCFVAQPGSGDSIQFLKAGILEMPHVLVVNKHDMGQIASRTVSELSGAVAAEHPDGNWQVPVLATSATGGSGIEKLADVLERHHRQLVENGLLRSRRNRYQAHWVLRRLQAEYGRSGLAALGHEDKLLTELEQEPANPFVQFESLRRRLANQT